LKWLAILSRVIFYEKFYLGLATKACKNHFWCLETCETFKSLFQTYDFENSVVEEDKRIHRNPFDLKPLVIYQIRRKRKS
jgi:hypothetical protein